MITAPAPLPPGVVASRWGFHPCTRETDKKLRRLNRALAAARAKAAAWNRWARKLPHHRVARPRVRDAAGAVVGYGDPVPLKEPALPPAFVAVRWDAGLKRDVAVVADRGVPAAATAARTPVADPAAVAPLGLSMAEIDALLAAAGA